MIGFWDKKNWLNYLLIPLAFIWQWVTFLRLKLIKGKVVKPLVVCVGNIAVGGGGKTPFTLYLATLLQQERLKVGILSRGYGGKVSQKLLVVDNLALNVELIGDEACLLSKAAPLIISKNRAFGGAKFAENNFDIILMDDGLQNPTLKKDINILLLNTLNPFGNGLVIPAGPLREKLSAAKKRIDIVVGLGKESSSLNNLINNLGLKYLFATIKANTHFIDTNKSYLAFASIAYPSKFFTTLKENNIKVAMYKTFKDHYLYNEKDIQHLIKLAQIYQLRLITTAKDYVKINPKYYSLIDKLDIEVILSLEDKNYILNLIKAKMQNKTPINPLK